MDDRWQRVWSVFHAVRESPPDARERMLLELSGGDDALRLHVTRLLRADSGKSPLDEPPVVFADDIDQADLAPGAVLAGRYRIVSLLGRGGMGSVYRADDLKLGQAVALKFLPPSLARHGPMLDRLLAEVRISRQVSHPNVCRVHDIVEAEGQHFFAMEYIDGEDLASLLRRIGRLPADKVLEIARGICAGLGAAHDRGVIHRDLKPANIMVDGRGRPRITDFGIAGLAEDSQPSRAIAGTPEYMAPEQLSGRGTSVRSDLYSLGLILYEMATGKRVFDGSLSEVALQHNARKPLTLDGTLRAIDPAVERVVLWCLSEDPAARPPSAHAVMAALPGGDPLAAAVAAGETPSPAMVAAANRVGDLQPWLARTLLTTALAGVLLTAFLAGMTFRSVAPEKPPEVLADRAADIVALLGYGHRAEDHASWFAPHEWMRDRRGTPAISFWYRQSPATMQAGNIRAAVMRTDPPETVSGMAAVNLDTRGRLLQFRAVPPPSSSTDPPRPDVDWSHAFAAAGLDLSRFKRSPPIWTPPFSSDRRAAWEGTDPHRGNAAIHIEGASYQGKPVWFEVMPVNRMAGGPSATETGTSPVVRTIIVSAIIVGLAGAIVLARGNMRRNRGDRKGAFRVAAIMFVARMSYALLRMHHVPNLSDEYEQLTTAIGRSAFVAGFVWILYMALEPYVRRRWPEMIISWNRLMSGQWRDPLVGRDILIGCIAGITFLLIAQLQYLLATSTGGQATDPSPAFRGPVEALIEGWGTPRQVAWLMLFYQSNGLLMSFLAVFLLVLFRVVFRSTKVAVGAWVLLALSPNLTFPTNYAGILLGVISAALGALIVTRVGLLAAVTSIAIRYVLLLIPITLDFSVWYAGRSTIALLIVALIAIYGFRVSLSGRIRIPGDDAPEGAR